MSPRIRAALVILVSVAWGVSFVASLASHTYQPDPSVNAAFTLALGYVLYRGKSDGDDK